MFFNFTTTLLAYSADDKLIPENKILYFMHIVCNGDNLYEIQILFSRINKKNISVCRVLKIYPDC